MEQQTINTEYGRMLANLIRDNLSELIDENGARYSHDYAYSINNRLDKQTKHLWAKRELLSIAQQLESGQVDPNQYETMHGDIVIQREELLYPIDAFLEMTFYMARMIADLVWEKNMDDTRTLNALLRTLEAFVQLRTCESLAAFSKQISEPRALIRTWQLGHRWSRRETTDISEPTSVYSGYRDDVDNGTFDGHTAHTQMTPTRMSVREPSILDKLTAREAQIAQLVAQGKSNNEVASALGLQLSTVRNALSRIYVKLGIASRSELIVALARDVQS